MLSILTVCSTLHNVRLVDSRLSSSLLLFLSSKYWPYLEAHTIQFPFTLIIILLLLWVFRRYFLVPIFLTDATPLTYCWFILMIHIDAETQSNMKRDHRVVEPLSISDGMLTGGCTYFCFCDTAYTFYWNQTIYCSKIWI